MPSEIQVDPPKYINLKSGEDWKNAADKCINENRKIIIDFYAEWCRPCKMIAPLYADLSNKYPETIFLKVNTDTAELKQLVNSLQVSSLPTFIVIEHNQETKKLTVIDKLVGANPDKLQIMVQTHAQVQKVQENIIEEIN